MCYVNGGVIFVLEIVFLIGYITLMKLAVISRASTLTRLCDTGARERRTVMTKEKKVVVYSSPT